MMLTRKEFLQTVGGAALSSTLAGPTSAGKPAMPNQARESSPVTQGATATSKIKRCVTFYCYQDEYKLREMSLEDCVAATAELGAEGVEILGEESVPNFPHPSKGFVDGWHALMLKYGTKPACYDAFLEMQLLKSRSLTLKESVDMVVRDIKVAKALGFSHIRALRATPPEVMEHTLPYLEQYDMKMGVEIHSSASIRGGFADPYINLIEKKNSKHLGLVPDLSLFAKVPPRVQKDWFVRNGAHAVIVEDISKAYQDNVSPQETKERVRKMGGNKMDEKYANDVYNHGPITNEPKDLMVLLPYSFHIHAKFYEVTEDYRELTIPYQELIPVIVASGYSGYLSSEYEGQRYTDDAAHPESIEQVRRHQLMLKRLLGEA
jgi:sugar phosphate isomerase/epimerase